MKKIQVTDRESKTVQESLKVNFNTSWTLSAYHLNNLSGILFYEIH